MNPLIQALLDRHSRALLAVSVLYGTVCAAIMCFGFGGHRVVEFIGAWGSFPVSLVICGVLWPTITNRALAPRRRRAWQLLFAALVLDVVASIGWGYSALSENVTFGTWQDALYLFYYPLAAIACALLYVDLGGRFDTPRALIDFATLVIGFGALLWFTALAPLAGMSRAELLANWSVIGYGAGNAIALIAGALLAMQISNWRGEKPLVWLLIAMVTTLVADLLWVNAELRNRYVIGGASDVMYFVYYLCLLVAAEEQRRQPQTGTAAGAAGGSDGAAAGLAGDLRGSLPIVALMVGAIALLDSQLGLARVQSPMLIVVIVSATLLVLAGQAFATREVATLHREVATRRFDERLTELVRRSSDMIAICDTDGTIRYASPSAEQNLRTAPATLVGHKLDELLGADAVHVRALFDQVREVPHAEQTAVFSRAESDGEVRSFKMVIANLTHVESIRGITLNIRDVTDTTRLHDQLRTLAFHDSLTLLANRSLFSDRVHQAIRHVTEGRSPAVLFIDLDNFKTINDSLGHSAGDALLRNFAHRLVQSTRTGDTVARLGGDEFAVLLDHAPDIEAALAVARQILESCRQPFEVDGRSLRAGCSIGVALADRTSNVERLLRNADAAMYSAKSHGKGHAVAFAPEMLRAARRRIRIESELALAIEQRQFEAHYQPIVDLGSRHLVGVEVLMRWRHPVRGLVMPGEFIALAEETGQILPMTEWMLERACADLARLRRELPLGDGLRVSVNVSSRYLNHGNVVADVRNALARHGLPADCLVLEVTESLLLEDSARIGETFTALKLEGVRLALDDFGTGFSSLAYLHRFPIDILKIDRSFVERLRTDSDRSDASGAVALARAILSLAEALGLDTVAEGIEYEEQRGTLLEIGCKTGQGYAFGKPMPIDAIFDAAVTRRRTVIAENLSSDVGYTATGRFRALRES